VAAGFEMLLLPPYWLIDGPQPPTPTRIDRLNESHLPDAPANIANDRDPGSPDRSVHNW